MYIGNTHTHTSMQVIDITFFRSLAILPHVVALLDEVNVVDDASKFKAKTKRSVDGFPVEYYILFEH